MKQSSPRAPAPTTSTTQPPRASPASPTSSRPYETRRVNLSLEALGIALPGRHGNSSSNSHRSSQSSASTPSTPSTATGQAQHVQPPQTGPAPKRVKRSHTTTSVPGNAQNNSNTITLSSRPRVSSNAGERSSPSKKSQQQQQQQQTQSQSQASRLTPPPSPRDGSSSFSNAKVDTEGINDDIVVGVIKLLESTGNRPHLIKEFAVILHNSGLSSVQSSANPTAIISSRLTNYLKRPWTALAPCPLTKEQVTTHPRRVYYYLTTTPRQPIPEYVEPPMPIDRVSPAVSSDQDEVGSPMDEVTYGGSQLRNALSPSPEVEFAPSEFTFSSGTKPLNMSSSTFDDEDPHGFGAFTDDAFSNMDSSDGLTRNTRAVSPPLEHDEREFTAMASSMQLRRATEQAEQQLASAAASAASPGSDHSAGTAVSSPSANPGEDEELPDADAEEETEENAALANRECAEALFGGSGRYLLSAAHPAEIGSSPMLRPTGVIKSTDAYPRDLPKKSVRIFEGGLLVPGQDSPVPGDVPMFNGTSSYTAWDELRSPEHVALHELDDMFSEI